MKKVFSQIKIFLPPGVIFFLETLEIEAFFLKGWNFFQKLIFGFNNQQNQYLKKAFKYNYINLYSQRQ